MVTNDLFVYSNSPVISPACSLDLFYLLSSFLSLFWYFCWLRLLSIFTMYVSSCSFHFSFVNEANRADQDWLYFLCSICLVISGLFLCQSSEPTHCVSANVDGQPLKNNIHLSTSHQTWTTLLVLLIQHSICSAWHWVSTHIFLSMM